MWRKFRISYFAHSLRSDWNNGNAHFLRGLLRSLIELGHPVTLFEPANAWSIDNLRGEEHGHRALQQFAATYPELLVQEYDPVDLMAVTKWRETLLDTDIVIVHEWNPPALAELLLKLRTRRGSLRC